MARILITGVSGLLGSNLAFAYRDKYKVLGIYHTHKVNIEGIRAVNLNLLDADKIDELINKFHPDVLIHCAALTDVDRCEEDKTLAYQLNVEVTKNVVRSLEKARCQLVYISTDSVYDGTKGDFQEEQVNPINYYGQTKLLGEKFALDYKDTLIIRTNFFGWNIQEKFSLAEWILNSLKNGKPINAFYDVIFSSIYTKFLAEILYEAFHKNLNGIYNLGSTDSLSKHDFAMRISEIFQLNKHLINKISVDSFPFKAKRGKNLSLDVRKIQDALDIRLPKIEDSIKAFYKDYTSNFQGNMKR